MASDTTRAEAGSDLQSLVDLVELGRRMSNARVLRAVDENRLSRDAYVRFLTNQYYLTKGVQKSLLRVVGSNRLQRKRRLREFLYRFALEEEPHYLLALSDLEELGQPVPEQPMMAAVWRAYFDSTLEDQPFQRIGCTCVLENIGSGLGPTVKSLFQKLDFLTPNTTRFLLLHLHEEVPHGEQILAALTSSKLEPRDIAELMRGARVAVVSYLRMVEWYFHSDEILALFDDWNNLPEPLLSASV